MHHQIYRSIEKITKEKMNILGFCFYKCCKGMEAKESIDSVKIVWRKAAGVIGALLQSLSQWLYYFYQATKSLW